MGAMNHKKGMKGGFKKFKCITLINYAIKP